MTIGHGSSLTGRLPSYVSQRPVDRSPRGWRRFIEQQVVFLVSGRWIAYAATRRTVRRVDRSRA